MVNDHYENLLTFEQIELTRLIFKPDIKAKEEFHIIQAQNDNSKQQPHTSKLLCFLCKDGIKQDISLKMRNSELKMRITMFPLPTEKAQITRCEIKSSST